MSSSKVTAQQRVDAVLNGHSAGIQKELEEVRATLAAREEDLALLLAEKADPAENKALEELKAQHEALQVKYDEQVKLNAKQEAAIAHLEKEIEKKKSPAADKPETKKSKRP